MKRNYTAIFPAVAFFIAAALYAHTSGYGFMWDDDMLIGAAGSDVSLKGTAAKFAENVDRLYRPARSIMFSIETSHGADSGDFHISNVALHALSAALFFYVVMSLTGSVTASAASGILFAVHPAHVEVVSSITNGRSDLLCSVFAFASMIAFMSEKRLPRMLSVALFACALLSKETAVVLPAAFFLIAAYKPDGTNINISAINRFKQGAVRSLPFFVAATVYVIVRGAVLGRASQATGWHGGSIASNMFTLLSVVPGYAFVLFAPVKQCAIYVVEPLHNMNSAAAAGAAILAGCAVAALAALKKHFTVAFAILFIALTWLPASNIIPIASIKALRFMYLPSAGACILAAVVFEKLSKTVSPGPKAAAVLMAALTGCTAAIWGISSYSESAQWRDAAIFWERTTQCAPASPVAWNNRANTLAASGDFAGAENAFKESIKLNPSFPQPYANLAAIYGSSGRYNEAISMLLKKRSIDPSPDTDCRLAFAYRKVGAVNESEKYYGLCQSGIAAEKRRAK